MTSMLIVGTRGGKVVKTTMEHLTLNSRKILELSNRDAYIRRHLKRLIGKGITQNQAAQKYDVPGGTLSRWRAAGRIKTVGVPADDPTAILIDESDVAYCAAAFHAMGTRPGQKLFNADGSLYIPAALRDKLLEPA